jgi:hypothetical protein
VIVSELYLSVEPSELTIVPHQSPQLCYVLVTVNSAAETAGKRAVNWALVADASVSMRIPILGEEQFRQLVREGGAQEVLVDGIPVWKLTRPVPEEMRAAAPGALYYVGRALHSVVEQLDNHDRFTLVACAQDALVLVPGTSGAERVQLVQGIEQLMDVPPGEETDLAKGLHLGLHELMRERRGESIQRLLLLTDGFTQNAQTCLELAQQAARDGVAISTIGLGGDFQHELLTRLADLSGGQALFLRHAENIPRAVAEELSLARTVVARGIHLSMQLSAHVALRRVTRIQPTLTQMLPTKENAQTQTVYLGDIERGTTVQILLEVLAPAMHLKAGMAARRLRLARLQLTDGTQPDQHQTVGNHEVLANYTWPASPLALSVATAAAWATVAHLQQTAQEALAAGEQQRGMQLLRSIAQRLHEMGETELALIAQHEAEALAQTGQTGRLGTKELTYATRRLGK